MKADLVRNLKDNAMAKLAMSGTAVTATAADKDFANVGIVQL